MKVQIHLQFILLRIIYKSFHEFPDEVRAPIPQKQEVLIQPGYEGYSLTQSSNMLRANRVRSVFDGFRNFSNEASKNFLLKPFEFE